MLEGLDDVDWARLSHAYGPASDVPELLRALGDDDPETAGGALYELYGNIWHQHTVYQATIHAVPFLVELTRSLEVSIRAKVLGLLGAIAESTDGEHWREVHAAVERELPHIVALLDDTDEGVRAGAAYVLGSFRDHPELAARLRQVCEHTQAPLARAGILVALARLHDRSAANQAWLASRQPGEDVERLATAYAIAVTMGEQTPAPVLELLAEWCLSPVETPQLFEGLEWDMVPERLPTDGLLAAGQAALAVLPWLRARLDRGDGQTAGYVGENVFDIAFAPGARLEAHDAWGRTQRETLAWLVARDWAWQPSCTISQQLRHVGLPSERQKLRAIL